MKMKKSVKHVFIPALLVFTAIFSCKKERNSSDENCAIKMKITSSQIVSRASGTEWWKDDEVGVYMVVSSNNYNSIYNSHYINESNDGEMAVFQPLSEEIYHPVDVSATYFAYYPYESNLVNNKYLLDTKSQEDLSKIDLMVSDSKVVSYLESEKGVDLSFKHKLSNVKVEIIPGSGFVRDNFDNIETQFLGLAAEGSYDLIASSNQLEISDTDDNIALFAGDNDSGNLEIEAIIIPQSGEDAKLLFNIVNSGSYSVDIPEHTIFEAGKQYVYTVTINQDQPQIESTSITDWVAGNNGGEDLSTDKDSDSDNSGSSSGDGDGDDNSDVVVDMVPIDLATVNTIALLEDKIKTTYSAGARGYTLIGNYLDGMFGNGTSSATSLFTTNAPELESLDLSGVIGLQLKGYDFANSKLSKIVLPTTITAIPAYTFANCSKLKEVNIENVTSLGANTFSNCSSLAELEAPAVVLLGDNCFEYCTSLKSLKLLSIYLSINSVTTSTFSNFSTTNCILSINYSVENLTTNNNICFGNITWQGIVTVEM